MRLLIVLGLVLAPSLAAADAASTREAMHEYFAGEKRGGAILIGMGVGGLVAGGLLLRSSNLTAKGASYPLLGIGVLHVAAGIYVYVASNGRIETFDAQITQDHTAFVREEQERMAGVSTQFTVLKIAELALATGGLAAAGIGWRTDRPRLKGAGLALAAEMLLTFGFDVFAARRAHDYRDKLAMELRVSSGYDDDLRAQTHVIVVGGTF